MPTTDRGHLFEHVNQLHSFTHDIWLEILLFFSAQTVVNRKEYK